MTINKLVKSALAVYVPAALASFNDCQDAEMNVINSAKHALFLNNANYKHNDLIITNFTGRFTNSSINAFSGYKLGEYLAGDNASLEKTVIASAISGTCIQLLLHSWYINHMLNTKRNIDFTFIPQFAVSSALLAYINYEEKTEEASELNGNTMDDMLDI